MELTLANDQVITNKLHYDGLLKKAVELEEEKKSKVVILQLYREDYSYGLSKTERLNPSYYIRTSIGGNVPKEMIETIENIVKVVNDAHSKNEKLIDEFRNNIRENQKMIRDISYYQKKLEEVPKWLKWLLNIEI